MKTRLFRTLSVILIVTFSGCAQTRRVHFTALPKVKTSTEMMPTPEALSAEASYPAETTSQQLEIHFIKVGQGDCTLVRCPNGRNILVDCGSDAEGDPDEVRSYLDEKIGNGPIDTLVISHPHTDHYNMLPLALGDREVNEVLLIGELHDHGIITGWLEEFPENSIQSLNVNYRSTPEIPSNLFGQGEVDFYVLAAEVPGNKNTRSIVLLISYDMFDVILTGDATSATENDILDNFPNYWLDCEVLKMGHHGSSTSSSRKWARKVKPEVSIATAAFGQKHGHPKRNIVNRLAGYADSAPVHNLRVWLNRSTLEDRPSYDKAIYSTATNGTIVVQSDGSAYDVIYDR